MISDNSENDIFETRKRKLLFEYEQNIRKKPNLKQDQLESLETHPKISPILADEYYRSIQTEMMFVGKVIMKQETSRLIKELSSVWPLEGKFHLKRVRWTSQKDIFEILIRPVHHDESVEISSSISLGKVIGDSKINAAGLMDTVVIHEVSKHPPLTYRQYEEAMKTWPVTFREDKYVEKVLNDKLFSSEERNNIEMFMKMCRSSAQYGDEKVGCVIVDPITSNVIAISHDYRHHHPIQHAVMVAVDLVAKSQGGGSWDINSEHVYHSSFSKDEIEGKVVELKKLNPEKDVKKMCLPYLCTGYDAYISREPCVMCAMALVHSRIRRVFYASSMPWGALGSHCKLHLLDGLNHHYEVWRVT